MTSTYLPERPPPTDYETPPPPPPPPRRSRALPLTVGGVLAAIGTVAVLAGSAAFAVVGNDGTIRSGTNDFSTPTRALVSSAAEVDDTSELASIVGQPEIGLSLTARREGEEVFIGVGPKDAVDSYLAGVPADEVTDFEIEPFKLDKKRRAGNGTPARPERQGFWVASASGHSADLDWKVEEGDYRIVVMNTDGSLGVRAEGQAEAGADHLSSVALGTMIGGLLALAGGIAVMVPKGGRRALR